MRHYTLPEARLILSHVFCVRHVPESDGFVYAWSVGAGEALCCRCSCREPADLRLYVASEREASEWLVRENAAIDGHNEEKAREEHSERAASHRADSPASAA